MKFNLTPQLLRAIKMSPKGVVPPSIQRLRGVSPISRVENPQFRTLAKSRGVLPERKPRSYKIYKAPQMKQNLIQPRGKLI